MSAFDYGPSLSDQGYGPDDAHFGNCTVCGTGCDEGDMKSGATCDMEDEQLVIRCRRCAATPDVKKRCAECGFPIDVTECYCGECACEDDGDIY